MGLGKPYVVPGIKPGGWHKPGRVICKANTLKSIVTPAPSFSPYFLFFLTSFIAFFYKGHSIGAGGQGEVTVYRIQPAVNETHSVGPGMFGNKQGCKQWYTGVR